VHRDKHQILRHADAAHQVLTGGGREELHLHGDGLDAHAAQLLLRDRQCLSELPVLLLQSQVAAVAHRVRHHVHEVDWLDLHR